MLALDLLPDLVALLPNVQFGQRLEIHVTVPTDPTATVTIDVSADGAAVPTVAGEVTMPTC